MQNRLFIFVILMLAFASAGAQRITNFGAVLSTESNTAEYKLQGEQFYQIYVPLGSEFFNQDWWRGYVVLENGDRYDNLLFKLNSYRNELIHLNERNSAMITLDKETISEIGLQIPGKEIHVFKKMTFDKSPRGIYYFEMLHDGKLKLVIWHRTTEDQTAPYMDKNGILRNSNFVLRSHYYLVFDNGDFEQFKLKRNAFLNLFGNKKPEIRKFLRTKHARYITEQDYTEAVKWIESEFY
jgi:hypothetical protein